MFLVSKGNHEEKKNGLTEHTLSSVPWMMSSGTVSNFLATAGLRRFSPLCSLC